MMAFVTGAVPVRSFASSLSTSAVSCARPGTAKWTMKKSASVPFVDAVPGLAELPAGQAEFDPLALSVSLPIKWMQEAEIKHGRVCMLAFLGAIVQEAYTFPWYTNAPKLFTLGHDYGARNGSLLQVLIFTSFFEVMTLPAVIQMIKGESDRAPGDFGLDLFGMKGKDPLMSQKEIKNGRLAMLAISGVLTTEVLTGQGIIAQLVSGNVIPKF